MAKAGRGYAWIAGIIRTLEVRYGPFWESVPADAASEPEEILRRGDEFEVLLTRLVLGRKRSVAVIAVLLIPLGALLVAMRLAPTGLFLYLDIAFCVFLFVAVVVLQFGIWQPWFLVLYGSYTLPPSKPAPLPEELLEGMRRLCGDFILIGEGPAATVLSEMRTRSPLLFAVCIRTTVASSVVQRRLAAA